MGFAHACARARGARYYAAAAARDASASRPPDPGGDRAGAVGRAYGFPRACRLRRRAEFKRVYEGGVKIVRGTMVVFAAPGSGPTRIGITATRKLGGAPARNRAKRRVREAFRRLRPGLPEGLDLVVVARAALLERPAARVAEDLETAVRAAVERLRCS